MNYPSDGNYSKLIRKLKEIMYSNYNDQDKLCLIEELIKYEYNICLNCEAKINDNRIYCDELCKHGFETRAQQWFNKHFEKKLREYKLNYKERLNELE